ncbi:MAG TPA: hypothetical protein VFV05_08065 [Methylomirabilota bacterium]|nr:hypothetical protein [Methylomirabilota bacterium]
MKAIESLGSWVVVTFNPASKALAAAETRCAAGRRIVAGLARDVEGFRPHPYPVTPYHSDYLHHADLAEREIAAVRGLPAAGMPALRLRARGRLAETLAGGRAPAGGAWDAVVEEIAVADLLAAQGTAINGWIGPPWIKEGWLHAWALLAPSIADAATRRRVDDARGRVTGGSERLEARITHERELVAALGAGCERVVAGYTVRREWLNDDYSAGVENVAADAQAGLGSPIFVRTVKLKDFPWNGWLTLGLPARPAAAWNPVGGFTDAAGRLIWTAVGDPALFPEPFNNGWTDNRVRVESVDAPGRPIPIPRDALGPEHGTGVLRKVGEGKTAQARVTYQVLTSTFHDGTRTSAADALYPYAFAAAWATGNGAGHDGHVERATALAREALAGVKVVRVETKTLRFGQIAMQYEVPIVEVYLARGGLDPQQLAALAPPWSAVPWPALALMEEAVRRGVGAFSAQEAARRRVPWLDLVRDARVRDRLTALLKELEAQGHVPAPLRHLVDAREARRRWGALARFAAEHGHFLVTNGPYQIHAVSPERVVLRVVRDFSYPLGVGSWNRYPIPLRAFAGRPEVRGDRVEVPIEVERLERFAREYRIVTEPLAARFGQRDAELPACRFVVLGPGGAVARAGTARPIEPGVCAVGLQNVPRPATVLVSPSLNGNHVEPQIKMMRVD